MNSIIKDEIIGKNIIIFLVLAGISFSALSFFILDNEIQEAFSLVETSKAPIKICENGLCYFKDTNSMFVQLDEDVSTPLQVLKNEEFTNLKLVKNIQTKSPQISANKITLFAEKDSFIREGAKNSNEGANSVLRIMGSGPTNNRVLISFNQDDILTHLSNKTLKYATLNLYIESNNHNWGDGQFVNLHKFESDWKEGNQISTPVSNVLTSSNGVTWSCPQNSSECSNSWNGGKFDSQPTDSIWISNTVEGYWIKFDVTLDILDLQSSENNFGWIIIKNDENSEGQINISSKESQKNIPELVMVFSDE
ncbi:MAG TPA: DNRLRE domain-containing protein [Nitrosopumilaceae archaeon]|nr:DNRLRE domain-containing protein [Nitrosopumilaceae archaeon]